MGSALSLSSHQVVPAACSSWGALLTAPCSQPSSKSQGFIEFPALCNIPASLQHESIPGALHHGSLFDSLQHRSLSLPSNCLPASALLRLQASSPCQLATDQRKTAVPMCILRPSPQFLGDFIVAPPSTLTPSEQRSTPQTQKHSERFSPF